MRLNTIFFEKAHLIKKIKFQFIPFMISIILSEFFLFAISMVLGNYLWDCIPPITATFLYLIPIMLMQDYICPWSWVSLPYLHPFFKDLKEVIPNLNPVWVLGGSQ